MRTKRKSAASKAKAVAKKRSLESDTEREVRLSQNRERQVSLRENESISKRAQRLFQRRSDMCDFRRRKNMFTRSTVHRTFQWSSSRLQTPNMESGLKTEPGSFEVEECLAKKSEDFLPLKITDCLEQEKLPHQNDSPELGKYEQLPTVLSASDCEKPPDTFEAVYIKTELQDDEEQEDAVENRSGLCISAEGADLERREHKKRDGARKLPSMDPETMRTEVIGGRKTLCCRICPFKTVYRTNFRSHLFAHTGERPYSCSVCYSSFKLAGHLSMHKLRHTRAKPYSCDLCAYSCSMSGVLKVHVRTHSGERPYSCRFCRVMYSFRQASALNRHMATHTGLKPYNCTVCPYRCIHPNDLKKHMATHTTIKPYVCTVCSFRCAGNLKRHMATHSTDKPFHCDQCVYKSSLKQNLTRHVAMRHGGWKPYGCAHCQYRAGTKPLLVKHLSRLHII